MLFSIHCQTCNARLNVRDAGAVGKILECPKCGSFVEVTPPEGWNGPPDEDTVEDPLVYGDPANLKRWPTGKPDIAEKDDAAEEEESHGEGLRGEDSGISSMASAGIDLESATLEVKQDFVPSEAPIKPSRWSASDEEGHESSGEGRRGIEPSLDDDTRLSPSAGASDTERRVRRWILMAAATAGVVIVGWTLSSFFAGTSKPEEPRPIAGEDEEKSKTEDAPPIKEKENGGRKAKPPPLRLDARWFPAGMKGVLSLRVQSLMREPSFQTLLGRVGPLWRRRVLPFQETFGVSPLEFQRLTYFSTDLNDWRRSVVVIELAAPLPEQQAEQELFAGAKSLELKFGDAVCRQRANDDWPEPFALVDDKTLVTGPLDLLQQLAKNEPATPSAALAHLLDNVGFAREATLMADLNAARQAEIDLPPAWLQSWDGGRMLWSTLRSLPGAMSLGLDVGSDLEAELHLACEGETDARQVHATLVKLVETSTPALKAEINALTARLQAGQINAASAFEMELLLQQALAAAASSKLGLDGALVWADASVRADLSQLALAAIGSVPAWERLRLDAAKHGDEANLRLLARGLRGYDKAEGGLPAAAAGSRLFLPERRLSWLATLLPYYDHRAWHQQLNFRRPWNDPVNDPITRRFFMEAINPAFGPTKTKAGYPVTHYVGVAGVGPGAAELPADHPNAGLFGHDRRITIESLSDGAGNTLAVLGVSSHTGPWSSGGRATVRGLTNQPYFNGPDGFGSGQPNGMLAAMADGSVRFFSRDMDPRVLEQLARIRGPKPVPMVAKIPEKKQPIDPPPKKKVKKEIPMPPVNPPPKVDVAARLALRLPAVEYRDAPLSTFVEELSQLTALQITLDVAALAEAGLDADEKISVKGRDITAGEVLKSALAEHDLVYEAGRNGVLITTASRQRRTMRQEEYVVGDLAPDADSLTALAGLVQKLVEPGSWPMKGGPGKITAKDGKLKVDQSASIHDALLEFLEKLRVARGRPPRRLTGVKLDTRLRRAWPKLSVPVTANFIQPAPLRKVLAFLSQASGVRLLTDSLELRKAGLAPDDPAAFQIAKRPLFEALGQLCDSLEISFRIVDQQTVQLTSRAAVSNSLELEFHPLGDLLGPDRTAPALVERIETQLAPDTWQSARGQGLAHYDEKSRCLLVLQTQPVQFQIEDLLNTLRAEEKAANEKQ